MVGNPPFLSQLNLATATQRGLAALIKARTDGATSAYTDTAAVFWIDALTKVTVGGRVAFLLPQSVLASRDASAIRHRISQAASLEHLWVSTDHAFADALVATCAVVVRNTTQSAGPVERSHSLEFCELPPAALPGHDNTDEDTWSSLAADAFGIPTITFASTESVGALAEATADFRDEYYGLSGFIVEHADNMSDKHYPPLITTGMIDPALNRWGVRPSRILKSTWQAPRINRQAMDETGTLSEWIDKRCTPKLLIATQSRVIELIVDEPGTMLPCMPVLTVTPKDTAKMWHIASVLGSPVACATAMSRYSGTALTTDAIKLAAKQLLKLPIPIQSNAWDHAADLYRDASIAGSNTARIELLINSAEQMNTAFDLSDTDRQRLMAWWTPRLQRTFER